MPKRFLPLLMLLLVPSPTPAAEWEPMLRDRSRAVELDRTSVLQSDPGTKVAWGRIVLGSEEVAAAGYASVKALNRYDCAGRSFYTIKRVYLDGDHNVIRDERVVDQRPISVEPGSVDERLWREVCKPPAAKDLKTVAEEAGRAAAAAKAKAPPPAPAPVAAAPAKKEALADSNAMRHADFHPGAKAEQADLSRSSEGAPPPRAEAPGPAPAAPMPGRDLAKPGAPLALPLPPKAEAAPAASHAQAAPPPRAEAPVPAPAAPAAGRDLAKPFAPLALPVPPKAEVATAAAPSPPPAPARETKAAPVHRPQPAVPAKAHEPARLALMAPTPEPNRASQVHREMHWDYEGEGGPDNWGRMNPEWAKCASGQRQSPIDIRDGIRVDQAPLRFDYRPSAARIVDNGHTVQVTPADGNTLVAQGRRFELVQLHFHRPSEERVDGRAFDMVAHLVHRDQDGRLGVVAVLMEVGASANPMVQTLWNNLPLEKRADAGLPDAVDLTQLLPASGDYYAYMGSLTTPPCTEDVLWLVLRQPLQISEEQLRVFARLYPRNIRPIQRLNDRLIKESR
jgi:carbonic anhydrase